VTIYFVCGEWVIQLCCSCFLFSNTTNGSKDNLCCHLCLIIVNSYKTRQNQTKQTKTDKNRQNQTKPKEEENQTKQTKQTKPDKTRSIQTKSDKPDESDKPNKK